MKSLNILIVCFLISIVYGDDVIFEGKNQKKAIHHFGESNRIQRSADQFVAISYDEYDEELQEDLTCKEFYNVSSSTGNPKILFEVIFSEPIHYMKVSKIDVMIYNRMSLRDPVDVEVIIPNDSDNSHFRFFNNKFDKKNEIELTKSINIPHGRARSFSFFIQTKDKIELNYNNIKLIASIKSENYDCYLKKRVNVEPVGVKVYDYLTNTYNLFFGSTVSMPVTAHNPYNSTKIEHIKMSVKITGNRTKSYRTDFSVTLTNEYDLSEVVRVTNSNADSPIEVFLPENTTNAKASIKGAGFCSITVVTETAVLLRRFNPMFNLKIDTLPSSRNNEAIVRVCAAYEPKTNDTESTLSNIIYDVEMASGYVYKEIINKNRVPEIKQVEPRWKKSRVQVFFTDFKRDTNYCVDIRATKIMEIKNTADAVVIVYDYNDKENVAVRYYNL